MAWRIEFTRDAMKDVASLGEPAKSHVHAALLKVAGNPLPSTEGGYGKPLGHRRAGNLTEYLKIKLKAEGIRTVYRLERSDEAMVVVVVSVRDDGFVYKEAVRRIRRGR